MKESTRTIFGIVIISVLSSSWYLVYVNAEKITNNSTTRIWCFAPSVVKIGEEFEINIQAWDKWEQLAIQYDQDVEILDFYVKSENDGLLVRNYDYTTYSLPQNITFAPSLVPRSYGTPEYYPSFLNDRGNLKVSNVTLNKPGIHYLKIESADGLITFSNPILVSENPTEKLFWGDIHGHTDASDGSGTPEFAYYYAREIACLDFAAVTDHDLYMSMVHLHGWPLTKIATNNFNKPNEFVTLVAYEWTRGFGWCHINVYYKGDDGPFLPFTNPSYDEVDKLLIALKAWKDADPNNDIIAIPHHPTSSANFYDWSYDWRKIDPEIVPLVEIYSCHGSGEMTAENGNLYTLAYLKGSYYDLGDGYNVQSALSMGYRVGLMSSSDTHDARIGHSLLHVDNYGANYPFATLDPFRAALPMPGGITGCWSQNLTRSEIFNGLKSRRVYATTHTSRPIVQFSINGVIPGENNSTVKVASAGARRRINLKVSIDGNYNQLDSNGGIVQNSIKKIEIVKNNENWKTYEYDSDRVYAEIQVDDEEDVTGMTYTGGETVAGSGYKITPNAKKYLDNQPSTDGVDVYYIRVTDNFKAQGWDWDCSWYGNQAWVGPIWVEID